jgi:hypothetical protein
MQCCAALSVMLAHATILFCNLVRLDLHCGFTALGESPSDTPILRFRARGAGKELGADQALKRIMKFGLRH